MSKTIYFDVQVIGQSWRNAKFFRYHRTMKRHRQSWPTHYRVRVTNRPAATRTLELPFAVGQEYEFPQQKLCHLTMLGDHEELAWADGELISGLAEIYAHAFQPDLAVQNHVEALNALRAFHAETMGDRAPDLDLAGRVVWASHLLEHIVGTLRTLSPAPLAKQIEGIKLSAQIFTRLNLKRIDKLLCDCAGISTGCRNVVELCTAARITRSEMVEEARMILQSELITYLPCHKPRYKRRATYHK